MSKIYDSVAHSQWILSIKTHCNRGCEFRRIRNLSLERTNELVRIRMDSERECQDICNSNRHCVAATWDKDVGLCSAHEYVSGAIQTSSSTTFLLKSDCDSKRMFECSFERLERGFFVHQRLLTEGIPSSDYDEENCRLTCLASKACVGYNFGQSKGGQLSCWTYSVNTDSPEDWPILQFHAYMAVATGNKSWVATLSGESMPEKYPAFCADPSPKAHTSCQYLRREGHPWRRQDLHFIRVAGRRQCAQVSHIGGYISFPSQVQILVLYLEQ